MTRNQQRAAWLAAAIRDGRVTAADLSDGDWGLLLLAAGLNACRSRPQLVATRILERIAQHEGYFTNAAAARERLAEHDYAPPMPIPEFIPSASSYQGE